MPATAVTPGGASCCTSRTNACDTNCACCTSTRAAIPDLDNHRYCRHCRALQPLSAFPKGKRRYVCRSHIWQCIKKQHQTRVLADAHRRMLFKQWQRCYRDARSFQHTRIDVTQDDLAKLLKPAVCAAFASGVHSGDDLGMRVAVLPRDPGQTLCSYNAVVVSNGVRVVLLRIRRAHGPEAYAAALKHCADMPLWTATEPTTNLEAMPE